jgi:hypothetical protein
MPLDYFARRVAGEARRFRQGFTRPNVISFLKTMAWVAPLTLLIWVYAERAQDTTRSMQLAIELKSTDPQRIVRLIKPYPDKFIICDLAGQSSSLDHFWEQLSPTDPLIINVDTSTMRLGENSVSTKQKIMDNSRLKADGITVDKCEPDTLTFVVDTVDERSAAITAPPGIATLKSATFDPPTIRVKGPKSELEGMAPNEQPVTILADIANLPILKTPGHHVVEVSLQQVDDLTYFTDKVKATLVVTDPDVSYTLTNVSVLLTAPFPVLRDNAVTWDGTYSAGINVVGPPDKIAQLRNGEVNPYPYLELQIASTDVSNPRQMPLTLRDLPEGVRMAPGQNLAEPFTATPR